MYILKLVNQISAVPCALEYILVDKTEFFGGVGVFAQTALFAMRYY